MRQMCERCGCPKCDHEPVAAQLHVQILFESEVGMYTP
jgi:hypothetical protein